MNLFRVALLPDHSSYQMVFIQSLIFCKHVNALHVLVFKLVKYL